MRKFGFTAMAAGLIGGAMLLSGSAPASATTLSGSTLAAPGVTTMIEQVQRRSGDRARHGDRARRYDSRRHGHRHRQARPGYHHYYGGYYYANPWWIGPSIGFGLSLPMTSAHVQWCLNRFRSYDPASNTYLGYDGFRHRCNSPYG
jgi:hypothetical protein